jgi:serine/threonine-protein kinase HipA
MISEPPTEAYVWTWLPDAIEPVVSGRLDRRADRYVFSYGRSYLERPDAVAIYEPELPLDDDEHDPLDGPMPLCIDDAAPDSWGRAVINAKLGAVGAELDPLVYLLESGSDRAGAIDFQASPTEYVPRAPVPTPLDQLLAAADLIDAGEPIDEDLATALVHGTPLGGARPKALIDDDGVNMLAKFTRLTDTFRWTQSEYVAMELARRAGLDVAPVRYVEVMGRGVLLVERFDRTPSGGRRRLVSAATVLSMQTIVAAQHFSYVELADEIRRRFVNPDANLRELFSRIMFNILVGNTDDHARNHAAFVLDDGLDLTPAYDVAPQPRSGETARHPRFGDDANGRESRIAALIDAAPIYHLTAAQGSEIADRQVEVIRGDWDEVCETARLTDAQRQSLLAGPILNPYAFYP